MPPAERRRELVQLPTSLTECEPPAAILFDLFFTLLKYRPDGLPKVEIKPGIQVPSSAPILLDTFQQWRPDLELDELLQAMWQGWKRAEQLRIDHLRETDARERFGWTLDMLKIDASADRIETAVGLHRQTLVSGTEIPRQYQELVHTLADHMPVGIITNYDDRAGADLMMKQHGIGHRLTTMVVSADAGMVKPDQGLFLTAIRDLDLPPEKIWYVGDTWDTDVVGAQQSGMQPVWYCANADEPEDHPDGVPVINDLRALLQVLR